MDLFRIASVFKISVIAVLDQRRYYLIPTAERYLQKCRCCVARKVLSLRPEKAEILSRIAHRYAIFGCGSVISNGVVLL